MPPSVASRFQPFIGRIWNSRPRVIAPGRRHFNRSLECIWNDGDVRARSADSLFQPFIGCIWNSGRPHARRARDGISTVHWVHLELGSDAEPVPAVNFNRPLGASGTGDKTVPTTTAQFQPSIGCIWNSASVAAIVAPFGFQPSIGCIWNHVDCKTTREPSISTVHWVHLERPATSRWSQRPTDFNRPLGASGIRRRSRRSA